MQSPIHARGNSGPLTVWQFKVAAQAGQRWLFDGSADSQVRHQAVGGVRLAATAVTGFATANEQVSTGHQQEAWTSGL